MTKHTQERVLEILKENPELSYKEIAKILNLSPKKIKETLISIKKRGLY